MSDAVEAWDCHVHVIGDRDAFPLSPLRGYEPPDAPLEALLDHLDRIGAGRAVVVQPSVYGFDNSCLLDALRRGEGRCVGVAVPRPDASLDELDAMHAAGVRGVRCNLVNPGGLPLERTRGWWPWMVERRWHLELQLDATRTNARTITDLDGIPEVVIDHMGYPPRGAAPDALANLIEAVSAGVVHVKVSAPYRISAQPAPHADAQRLAQALIAANPRRCLWASDWPHTELPEPPMEDRKWRDAMREAAGAGWATMSEAAADLFGR